VQVLFALATLQLAQLAPQPSTVVSGTQLPLIMHWPEGQPLLPLEPEPLEPDPLEPVLFPEPLLAEDEPDDPEEVVAPADPLLLEAEPALLPDAVEPLDELPAGVFPEHPQSKTTQSAANARTGIFMDLSLVSAPAHPGTKALAGR
jgi:hypothetical protein